MHVPQVSGIELAACCRDQSDKHAFVVMLVGAGLVLKVGTGIAFLGALVSALALGVAGKGAGTRSADGEIEGSDEARQPQGCCASEGMQRVQSYDE